MYSLIQELYSCCACSLSDSDSVSIHGDPATGSLCPGQCKKLALYCLLMSTSVRLFMLLVAAEVTQAGSVGGEPAIQITIHTYFIIITDCFYIVLFSALMHTHRTLVTCDSE